MAELKARVPVQPAVGIYPGPPVGGDDAPMVLVRAGEFIMGSEEGESDEKPVHRVYLDAFSIDAYEVTNARYGAFIQATGRRAPMYWNDAQYNVPAQPVRDVTWSDAEAYCHWAGKRLPTEAEWEKAARGTDGRTYPWGNQWDRTKANTSDGGPGKPMPVGSYEGGKSPYGAYDMAGNVEEWVADWYYPIYYKRSPSRNPKGPASGRARVLRGGSWTDPPQDVRAANRALPPPDLWSDTIGFRCAKTP